ncbi:hypothetical protein KY337_02800 [Candidatus Woesearchaeota archaeon]|nr:hypothetical protein [Candidatus Woesearchaeota archaeon]
MEEYEMMSHNKLKSLETSMEKLSKNLNDMIDMFSSAATAMHVEEKEEKALDPVMKKLDTLIDQNQKIASGILAVADMVKEVMPKIEEALIRLEHAAPQMQMPRPMPRPMPMHKPMSAPMHAAPRPAAPMPSSRPPMPPGLSAFEKKPAEKKSGMLGGLFK